MKAKTQRLVVALVVALATAVVLVGGAQADRPDNRAGVLGVGAAGRTASPPDWFERAVARSAAPIVRPDDRAGVIGAGGIAPAIVASARARSTGGGCRHPRRQARRHELGAGRLRRLERIRLGRCLDQAVGFVLAMFLLGAAATLAAPASAARHAPVAGNGPALLPRLCDARTPG